MYLNFYMDGDAKFKCVLTIRISKTSNFYTA